MISIPAASLAASMVLPGWTQIRECPGSNTTSTMSDVIDREDSREIREIRPEARKIFCPTGMQNTGDSVENGPRSDHAVRMARTYSRQAPLFDLTRAPVLFGRPVLADHIDTGASVLEVGCGTGHNLATLSEAAGPSGRVFGVECAPAMLDRVRRRGLDGVELIEAEYGVDPLPEGIAPLDAIVFSYSLSMIPEFDRILHRAHSDLRNGGRIVVLDFMNSPSRLMCAWMRSVGVSLGPARTDSIAEHFSVTSCDRRRAWLGLWRYQMLVAQRVGPWT